MPTKRAAFFAFAAVWAAIACYPPVAQWAAGGGSIVGRVLEAGTGAPVGGAIVRLQASLTDEATTRKDGTFTLRTTRPAGEPAIVTAAALDPSGAHPAYYTGVSPPVSIGDEGIEIVLTPILAGDDRDYDFVSPNDCTLCHEPYVEAFAASAHRDAARNVWVRDMYDGSGTPSGARGFTYKDAHPNLNGDCAECHAPMQSAKNPGDNTDFSRGVSDHAREWGVSCDVCHKTVGITNVDLPGVLGMTFRRGAATDDPAARREAMFGPLADASAHFGGLMRAAYSPLHAQSLLCAACHEDNNDHDLDGDYLDEGSVPSEESYSEWLASAYAQPGPDFKTCQTCHMPPTGATVISEQYGTVARDPSQVHAHDFQGTTDVFVQNAATVRVIAAPAHDRLRVTVGVTNDRAGHDLPGGIFLRHAILLVTARDARGQSLTFFSDQSSVVPDYAGVGDPAEGNFAGLPGKGFAKIFTDGARDGVFFTEAQAIASDTRIPAGTTDWSAYVFALPPETGPVSVEAKLIYRRAFRVLTLEKNWTITGHGRPNPDLQSPEFGVVMGAATAATPAAILEVDSQKVRLDGGLRLQIARGTAPVFAPGVQVDVSDERGAWHGFSLPARLASGGQKLIQKGKIAGLKLGRYWLDGSERFVRVTNPDGSAAVLHLRRRGTRFEVVG
jgi:hypothetical protein